MKENLGKKIDLEKLVEKYLSRMNGNPDPTRLLLNMLVDNVTDITVIRNYIIKHEFNDFAKKKRVDRAAIIERLSAEYGLSKKQILEIVES